MKSPHDPGRVDTGYYKAAQMQRLHTTMSEPSCELWTSGVSVDPPVVPNGPLWWGELVVREAVAGLEGAGGIWEISARCFCGPKVALLKNRKENCLDLQLNKNSTTTSNP